MIVYNKDKKELVIPVGLGNGNGSGSGDYDEGYNAGFRAGVADQKSKLSTETFRNNGVYSRADGWRQVTVDVDEYTPSYGIGEVGMQAIQKTYTKDDLRPYAPGGEVVYGGSISDLEAFINDKGKIFIFSWDNAQHTDRTQQVIIRLSGNTYVWENYQGGTVKTFDEIPNAWTQVDGSGHLFARNDGSHMYFYETYQYGVCFTDNNRNVFPNSDLILPLEEYDAISAITVNAINVYNSGYTAGQKNPSINSLWVRLSSYTHNWPASAGISEIEFGDYYNGEYHNMTQFVIDSIEEDPNYFFDIEASGTCVYTGDTINYVRLRMANTMEEDYATIWVSVNGIEFKADRFAGHGVGDEEMDLYIYFEPED